VEGQQLGAGRQAQGDDRVPQQLVARGARLQRDQAGRAVVADDEQVSTAAERRWSSLAKLKLSSSSAGSGASTRTTSWRASSRSASRRSAIAVPPQGGDSGETMQILIARWKTKVRAMRGGKARIARLEAEITAAQGR
jgi:hypothetical protein